MLIRVDPSSDAPLFRQIADAVRAEMATGALGPGDRLPAAREIADGLEVNVHTALHAYQDLRDEGLVELRRGRGAVVTEAAAALATIYADITALAARANDAGIKPPTLTALVKDATRATV